DARLIAYEADLGDGTAIYVQGWGVAGPLGDPLRVSAPGAKAPVWARKGRTLFFITSKSRIEAATITTSPRLAASITATPWDLVRLEIADNLYDMLPDGRLLGIRAGYGERGPSGFQLQHGLVSAIPMKTKDAER
ncbi:MAG TPA: hypothetical protein VFP58_13090, partial [Candidatus Eisenbacteria bacterium]|nr:hypothetical protein [Candidatus Eisenbacteria bacterium]